MKMKWKITQFYDGFIIAEMYRLLLGFIPIYVCLGSGYDIQSAKLDAMKRAKSRKIVQKYSFTEEI